MSSIRGEYSSIRDQAHEIINNMTELEVAIQKYKLTHLGAYYYEAAAYKYLENMLVQSSAEGRGLIGLYRKKIQSTEEKTGLKLEPLDNFDYIKSGLRQLIVECEKVIASVESQTSNLSETDLDRLNILRNQLTKVCEPLEENFEKNMNLAIESAESDRSLASVLIAGRVVDYIFSQWKGAFGIIDEKNVEVAPVIIQKLVEKGLIDSKDESAKQTIIKSNKKIRNFYSHRIDSLADISDALSLLGDTMTLLKIFAKFKKIDSPIESC